MNVRAQRIERTECAGSMYTEKQTRRWLAWLALGMTRHGKSVFLIEELQPSWLVGVAQRWVYVLTSRSLWGLTAALGLSLSYGLEFWVSFLLNGDFDRSFSVEEIRGGTFRLLFGLIGGLIGGLLFGLIDVMHFEGRHPHTARPSVRSILDILSTIVVFELLVGLLYLMLQPFNGGLDNTGLNDGGLVGLLFGLVRMRRHSQRTAEGEIQTVETLVWSWRASMKGVFFGLVGGLIGGLVLGLMSDLNWASGELVFELTFGLFMGLLIGLVGGLLGGFVPGVRAMKIRPNKGIRLSIRNSLLMSCGVALICGAFNGLIMNPILGLAYGVLSGLCAGLWFGGLDAIQHYLIRIILYFSGNAPLRYARFLDYAADELNFLQRVGGGYVFIHRYLLEHFAEMDVSDVIPVR